MERTNLSPHDAVCHVPPRHVALDKRDRLSPLESSQAAAVGTGDLAGPGGPTRRPRGAARLPPSVSLNLCAQPAGIELCGPRVRWALPLSTRRRYSRLDRSSRRLPRRTARESPPDVAGAARHPVLPPAAGVLEPYGGQAQRRTWRGIACGGRQVVRTTVYTGGAA